jgi:hypothetical protein
MLNKKTDIFVENVAIVHSQDSNAFAPPITVQDFFNFTGDINATVQVIGLRSESVDESPWIYIKSLFGAWIENGEEDKHLENLYKSRLIPSSLPVEDE